LGGLCSIQNLECTGFATVSEVKAYAARHPEYVVPDTYDWLHPDFSSFYRKNKPGWMGRIALRLGLNRTAWDARKLKALMQHSTEMREKDGLQGDFVEQYKPHTGDKLIVWGDPLGAFHSLVRGLVYLNQQGVINNVFKIVKPNYVLIFLARTLIFVETKTA
jgi:hypothetical protein